MNKDYIPYLSLPTTYYEDFENPAVVDDVGGVQCNQSHPGANHDTGCGSTRSPMITISSCCGR